MIVYYLYWFKRALAKFPLDSSCGVASNKYAHGLQFRIWVLLVRRDFFPLWRMVNNHARSWALAVFSITVSLHVFALGFPPGLVTSIFR